MTYARTPNPWDKLWYIKNDTPKGRHQRVKTGGLPTPEALLLCAGVNAHNRAKFKADSKSALDPKIGNCGVWPDVSRAIYFDQTQPGQQKGKGTTLLPVFTRRG